MLATDRLLEIERAYAARVSRMVALNPDTGTIEWPTGADFDPETLHNWPPYVDKIIERRKQLALA